MNSSRLRTRSVFGKPSGRDDPRPPGTLESEIDQGAWLLLPGDVDLVFSRSPLTVWQDLMARVGGPLEFYATMPPPTVRHE